MHGEDRSSLGRISHEEEEGNWHLARKSIWHLVGWMTHYLRVYELGGKNSLMWAPWCWVSAADSLIRKTSRSSAGTTAATAKWELGKISAQILMAMRTYSQRTWGSLNVFFAFVFPGKTSEVLQQWSVTTSGPWIQWRSQGKAERVMKLGNIAKHPGYAHKFMGPT